MPKQNGGVGTNGEPIVSDRLTVTTIKLRWGGDREDTKVSKEKTRVIKVKNHVSSRKSSNILLHSST